MIEESFSEDYDNKPVAAVGLRCQAVMRSWSDSANGLASFNSEAEAVGIRGTAGAGGTPDAEGILDRVGRERRAVAAVVVTSRIRLIRVRAQLAAIVPLLVIEPRGVSRIGIRSRLIAEGTAGGTEWIRA